MTRIVVDIYGADAGPAPVLEGVARALHMGLDFYPVLVGQETLITDFMDGAGIDRTRYACMDTAAFIGPCDPPNCIFGGRDDSSMAIGYGRLKSDSDCCAMLSAGNTGRPVKFIVDPERETQTLCLFNRIFYNFKVALAQIFICCAPNVVYKEIVETFFFKSFQLSGNFLFLQFVIPKPHCGGTVIRLGLSKAF